MMEGQPLRAKHLAGAGSALQGRRLSVGADPMSPRRPVLLQHGDQGALLESEEEAGSKRSSIDSVAKERLTAQRSASASKISEFLKYTKGFNSYSCEDLETMLYDLRFELLPAPKTGGGNLGEANRKLPLFSDIPSQEELHDMLISGAVPGGFQRVAHVLYPDDVPWPAEAELVNAKSRPSTSSRPGSVRGEDAASPRGSSAGSPRSPGAAAATTRPPLAPRRSTTERLAPRMSEAGGPPASPPRRSSTISSSALGDEEAADAGACGAAANSEQMMGKRTSEEVKHAVPTAEVSLRGQLVTTSLRGRTVPVKSEESIMAAKESKYDYDQYMAAKDKRVKLERTLQLEQYKERKLLERIDILEHMKRAEEEHQEELKAKEARRRVRMEELAKQMEQHHIAMVEEEWHKEEEKEEQLAKEAKADRRRRKLHTQKREEVERWKSQMSEDALSVREDDARLRREELWAKERTVREEKERNRIRPPKQVETEQRIVRTLEAEAERPPVAPRSHDKPASVFAMAGRPELWADESAERTSAPRPTHWSDVAKVAGTVYGLSEQSQALVSGSFERTVRGAGRMASYDKRIQGPRPTIRPDE